MGLQHRARDLGVAGAVGRARDHLSKAIKSLDLGEGQDRDSIVHEARKRIKRARALIGLARGTVGRKAIAKVDRRLREAAGPLSAARDSAVRIQTLDALADRSRDLAPAVDFGRVRDDLESLRDRVVSGQIDEGEALARASNLVRSARRRLRKWGVAGGDDFPVSAYTRTYRRGRAAFAEASVDPSSETLHRLRKRAKALGCQLKAVEADSAGPVARLRKLANLLADELGEVHDLDILRESLADIEAASPIFGPLDRRRLAIRHSALERAGVVFLDKPRVFAEMIRAATGSDELARAED